MKAENWQKFDGIINDALEMTRRRRQKYLEEVCRDAPELRREIEDFLAGEDEAEELFSSSAIDNYASFFADGGEEAIDLSGQEIGNYRIIREIGHGGMGSVYLAERIDGKFAQSVAVKLLRRELNSKDVRRNFNREKEILARLSHPHIARLLDAGTTADGIPYLAMEYIEGVPIDEYCLDNQLDLNHRLKLFNRICEAIAYAHRNLIVHRDLKPSNILVTAEGSPKLLDFGISKLLDSGSEHSQIEQPVTMLGALTPEYASPEQIRGEAVSTATDIYSLGIVLYKMLTGNLPYDFRKRSENMIFKAITETEPTMPSRSVSSRAEPETTVISSSQLKGDLDNILLKSISKNPEQRYETIEQFSADIWRFIDGLPVLARKATFSYQAKKFYQRNLVTVWAGVLIFISLIAGIVVSVSQAREAREQASAAYQAKLTAEREAEHAREEQEKAEKISRFVAKIVSYANPSWYAEGARYGGEAKVVDALEDLGDKIDIEFAGQADVQAELHHKFTEVYNAIRRKQKDPAQIAHFAEQQKFHALRALELRRQFYGEHHELVAKDMFYASSYPGKDDRERAEILAKAIQMMRETNPDNLNLPYMLESYAGNLVMPEIPGNEEIYRQAAIPATDENNFVLGERYLRETVSLLRFHYKEDNKAVIGNECVLSYALLMQDKTSDFDEHYKICKDGQEKVNQFKLNDEQITTFDLIEKALAEKRRAK